MPYHYVIAIDYGTAASGYAWALANSTNESNECKIKSLGNVNLGAAFTDYGGKDFSLVVTDSQGKLIPYEGSDSSSAAIERNHYFGREIFELTLTREDLFLHKRVKMDLYDPQSNKDEGINIAESSDPAKIYREIKGVKFYTLDLIAETLRELSQRALADITKRSQFEGSPQDALWVITLPADATQLQKDAMREAARRAGIVDSIEADNLILAFEPEAATIRIHCDDACRACFKKHAQNDKYITLIVDAGGGTVDLTAYLCDFNNNTRLVEAGNSRASNAGGTYLDQDIVAYIIAEYFPILDKQMPQSLDTYWQDFKSQDPEGYGAVLEQIIARKEKFRPEKDSGLRIYIGPLTEYCENRNLTFHQDKIKNNKVFVPKEKFETFVKEEFDKSIGSIVALTREVQNKYPNVPICYTMVGGFSCSSLYRQMVIERLKNEFKDGVNYVDLNNDNLRKCAVLTGATLYGDDPTMIDRRYCKYTFGTSKMWNFEPKRHQGRKIYTDYQGNKYAENGFKPLIKKGDELKNGRFDYVGQWQIRLQRKPDCGEIVETSFDLWEIQDTEIPEFLDDTEKKKQVATYDFKLTCDTNGEARYVLSFSADKTETRIKATDCSNDQLVLDETVHFSSDIWKIGR